MERPDPVTDAWGRTFKTLRVSVTGACQMRCAYCAPGKPGPAEPVADYRRLVGAILRLHARLELETVHFTGGEPLGYRDLGRLAAAVRAAAPVLRLRLTTNGLGLATRARELAEAGITGVNVSVDAAEEATFMRMTGVRGLSRVLRGIDAAREADLPVKVNTVVMRGRNEDQVVPVFRCFETRDIPVRFLELMSMGPTQMQWEAGFVGMREILAMLARAGVCFRALGREPSGTACYWVTPSGYPFGIIANTSLPFCRDCDRLRLDSAGNLYGCLSVHAPLRLEEAKDGEALTGLLAHALAQKRDVFTGSTLSMRAIGG